MSTIEKAAFRLGKRSAREGKKVRGAIGLALIDAAEEAFRKGRAKGHQDRRAIEAAGKGRES